MLTTRRRDMPLEERAVPEVEIPRAFWLERRFEGPGAMSVGGPETRRMLPLETRREVPARWRALPVEVMRLPVLDLIMGELEKARGGRLGAGPGGADSTDA